MVRIMNSVKCIKSIKAGNVCPWFTYNSEKYGQLELFHVCASNQIIPQFLFSGQESAMGAIIFVCCFRVKHQLQIYEIYTMKPGAYRQTVVSGPAAHRMPFAII